MIVHKNTVIGFLCLLNIILIGVWITGNNQLPPSSDPREVSLNSPEVREISQHTESFDRLKKYFAHLALTKSPEYTYQVMKIASLPPQTDLHLLAHAVGDVLYKLRGAKGIEVCTQDFRNACSHSIVVGLLMEKGPSALTEIAEICRSAPGGSGAYTMCFHGLGHGVLAYTGYDMPKTVDMCRKTGTQAFNFQESAECVGGAVMEITSGGDHDKVLWTKQSQKYLSSDKPLEPCTSSYITGREKDMCFLYLTTHLFQVVGGDIGNLSPIDYEKAFVLCTGIPIADASSRSNCFGGFGKEFIVLAQNRDIRKITELSNTQLKTINDWCMLAHVEDGIRDCIMFAVNSMYWGGENDPDVAVRFCSVMSNDLASLCYRQIIGAVGYYTHDAQYKKNFCEKLPEEYQEDCNTTI